MLSAADAELVQRDLMLPGLDALLDTERFTSVLHAAVPDLRGARVRATYVRYKPATRCLVAYEAVVDGAVRHLHANAYTRAGWSARRDRRASHIGVDELALAVTLFPHDDTLPTLSRLCDPAAREGLMQKLVPACEALHAPTIDTLAYKPGRRYVGLLTGEGTRAVVKLYGDGIPEGARLADRRREPTAAARLARCIARSRRHRTLLFEWLPGERLSQLIPAGAVDARAMRRVGTALVELHAHLRRARVQYVPQEADGLSAAARGIGVLRPALARRAQALAASAADALRTIDSERQPIHGDFYASQVLIGHDSVGILDLDRAGWGETALDLANFVAHLEYDVIHGRVTPGAGNQAAEALIAGYEEDARVPMTERVHLHAAAALLRLGVQPFRTRAARWDETTESVLDRAEALLRTARPARTSSANAGHALLPPGALDASVVGRHLTAAFSPARARDVRVRAIRVAHYKPDRRWLLEYDLVARNDQHAIEHFAAIAKVRAKGTDTRAYRLGQRLWREGFGADSADGISVPEPLAVVPELKMWLQRKVRGTPAAALLSRESGMRLGRRAAEVIHKLHSANVEPQRRHGLEDELLILAERLSRVAAQRTSWKVRLDTLLDACRRLLRSLPVARHCTVHRDFHPGQLLLDGPRAYLLDLDLCATGDPALDVGNFLAHVAEWSLRAFDDPDRLDGCEAELVRRYLELEPRVSREAIDSYRTVALARHVHISGLFPDRQPYTERILDYCESRIRLSSAGPVIGGR
jgi:streptomycin 6-kinase